MRHFRKGKVIKTCPAGCLSAGDFLIVITATIRRLEGARCDGKKDIFPAMYYTDKLC